MLRSAHGTVAKVKLVARMMRKIAKMLDSKGRPEKRRIRIQRINASVPAPSLAGGATEQNLPRCSAGCDMCSLYNRRCNRNLTGPLSRLCQPAEIKKERQM